MATVKRAGDVIRENTVQTGLVSAVAVRVLKLLYTHQLLWRESWSWENWINFLGEDEIQIVLGTVVLWFSNLVRSSMLLHALDEAKAGMIERLLGRIRQLPKSNGDDSQGEGSL